jgi:hypothetical protein
MILGFVALLLIFLPMKRTRKMDLKYCGVIPTMN